jgi:hypothetical protein
MPDELIACTPGDLAARAPEADPICEACGCRWSRHGFDGCTTVIGPGDALDPSTGRWTPTPARVCGCREVDPMCEPLAPLAAVVPIKRAAEEGDDDGDR